MKYTTRCNIPDKEGEPCGDEIVITSGIVPPELGTEPAEKTRQFVQAIVGHLMKKHPSHAAIAMTMMEQFLAFNVVGFTISEDPGCVTFMAMFAEYLCAIATLQVSDSMIVELVTRMGLTMEDPQRLKMIEALTYVRNFQIRKIGLQEPVRSERTALTSA